MENLQQKIDIVLNEKKELMQPMVAEVVIWEVLTSTLRWLD